MAAEPGKTEAQDPQPRPPPAGQLDGSVDRFDFPQTLSGWVKNSLRIGGGRDITVRIRRGDKVLAEGPLTIPRPDIIAEADYMVGFQLTCSEEISDEAFVFDKIAVEASDTDGRFRRLPIYDRTRSHAFERLLAAASPLGRSSASVILDSLAKSNMLERDARDAVRDVNDKHFEEENRRILYEFESLGKDCSLGSMHRAFGAEPLGLMRFTGIGVDGVTQAIRTRFAGVGAPEFTRLVADASGEYYSSDTRYHMSSHTYIFEGKVPFDVLFRKQCQKIDFLARNLMEKLESGEKILVVHAIPEGIPEPKLQLLWRTIRDTGPSPLLYLALATDARPPGSIFVRDDGIMVGYVLQIQGELIRPEAEIREGWMKVFRKAHAFARQGAALDPLPQDDLPVPGPC